MIYQDNGEWKPYLKKVNYTMQHEAYDNDTYPYESGSKFENVVVEDVALTPDQLTRLGRVKTLDTSIKDIEEYILVGTVNQENEELKKVVETATMMELVAKYVPAAELGKVSSMEVVGTWTQEM